MYDFDMIVIGSGPSGRRAAVQSAKVGKSVLVIEKGQRVGGVSVHTGTIPSKTLRETILNLSGWRERGFCGRSYRVKQDIDTSDLQARLQKTLDYEVEVLENQFKRNSVKMARGHGRFVGPNEIEVVAEATEPGVFTGANILIACGTRPLRPEYTRVAAILSMSGCYDFCQDSRAPLRNYLAMDHIRNLVESIRREIRQYLLESDSERLPFSRRERSLVYARARKSGRGQCRRFL